MSYRMKRAALCAAAALTLTGYGRTALTGYERIRARVVLIEAGAAKCAIHVPARVMVPEAKKINAHSYKHGLTAEAQRVRLRDSVNDLSHYLEKMSGARVEIVTGGAKADDRRIPILIGESATPVFGPLEKRTAHEQGFRLVVSPKGVGLVGESDLSTSYAIYELLHRLGCRWYMPSDMGEVIPALKTITLDEIDCRLEPYTLERYIWYCDSEYTRRNRMGGQYLAASHALEGYMPKELLEKHPEWRATDKNGKRHGRRLKWSKPGVAEAIAKTIIAKLDNAPNTTSLSLSPDDGLGYDDTDDRKLDAGDFDPSVQMVSITDRQVWLCNRVIRIVEKKHPNVLFGMLAYGQSTRPPKREKLHPNLVPEIAPITFTRAHPMTDDGEPNNKDFRYLVEGWGKAAEKTAYYFYGWYLAEPSAPNPFIRKWSVNLPYIYEKGGCRLWQPETTANFETTMHALYMGLRMAWDPSQRPQDIVAEIHEKFYGGAAKQMAEYWHYIDKVWVETPEYAGCGWGHLRRWTPQRLKKSRDLINAAVRAAKTPAEKFRIKMADESLQLFEDFMKLRRDLAAGRFSGLGAGADQYYERVKTLATQYKPQFAFGGVHYLQRSHKSLYAQYFKAFYYKTYQDADRLARGTVILTRPPLRKWRWMADEKDQGEKRGWTKPGLNDKAWPVTDTCVDTWSALGRHSYMGAMWYRSTVKLPAVPKNKRIYLWIGATDGSAKVYVNGKHCKYVDGEGKAQDIAAGYCKPFSFDITPAARAGDNQVTIHCVRTFINELGSGGILGAPVVIYREKD